MQNSKKTSLLLALTFVLFSLLLLTRPIPQPLSYHHFADQRNLFGIPNFFNVVSNLSFLIVGLYGFSVLRKSKAPHTLNLLFLILFLGITLTSFGSAFYHLNPNNDTLVWDRIPMTIIFMSFTAINIAECISQRLGLNLLLPLLFLGISSVLWWHYTEIKGHGDLRAYLFVQFYPMLFIPIVMFLYNAKEQKFTFPYLGLILMWYVVAIIFEHLDLGIYTQIGISGHTLKHLAASVSTLFFVLLFRKNIYKRNTLKQHSA